MRAAEAKVQAHRSRHGIENPWDKDKVMYNYAMRLVDARSLIGELDCEISETDFPFECADHFSRLSSTLKGKGFWVKELVKEPGISQNRIFVLQIIWR